MFCKKVLADDLKFGMHQDEPQQVFHRDRIATVADHLQQHRALPRRGLARQGMETQPIDQIPARFAEAHEMLRSIAEITGQRVAVRQVDRLQGGQIVGTSRDDLVTIRSAE